MLALWGCGLRRGKSEDSRSVLENRIIEGENPVDEI